jgi:hypothetical protein
MEMQVMQGDQSSPIKRDYYASIDYDQRESSATIKAPPIPYKQASPPTRQKIIEFDCRGLEFTEFKSEVSLRSIIG